MTHSEGPVWGPGWRDRAWDRLQGPWDVLVVGGGITGAGLLLEAARRGLSAALVEGGDFASGTSSRSGKLVHGGMRYLKQARLDLTRALLLERDGLLAARPGLVDPLPFILPTYRTRVRDRAEYATAVRLYDWLRLHGATWRRLDPSQVEAALPGVRTDALDGGYQYGDAVTEDARLVLRTLRDAVRAGALALSRARCVSLVREGGQVAGAEIADEVGGRSLVARARVVMNATGVWADALRAGMGARPRLRAIRGTHLVIPWHALPLSTAVGFRHPADRRYQYLLPWEGVILAGTTDEDDSSGAAADPRVTEAEVAYLLQGLAHQFPGAGIGEAALIGAFAGVRPVVQTGNPDPYRTGRDSVLWEEDGLVTVVSGKLTGFRAIVERALARVKPAAPAAGAEGASADTEGALDALPPDARRRIAGRYGPDAPGLVGAARGGELSPVEGTPILWAEVRWGARAEGVLHLDDLLLRRTRLGLILPRGGEAVLPRVGEICREELGWDAARWEAEVMRYSALWRETLAPPARISATPPA